MGPARPAVVCAADVGKTRCRVAVCAIDGGATRVLAQETLDGVPGLATAPAATRERLGEALDRLDPELVARAEAYGIGAAGARMAPAEATRLADALEGRVHHPVVVASDVLIAHVGALGGGAGTVAIAGTGAVAYHVAADARIAMADGWGPVIGDLGGGFWFGMRGLQEALAAADGRGPATTLTARARDWAPDGDLLQLPTLITGDGFARRLAGFARAVLEEAAHGDTVAAALRAEGVRHLVNALASVAESGLPVTVVGGLTDDPAYAQEVARAAAARGLGWQPPRGTGLDGAIRLAGYAAGVGPMLPHEPHLHRGASTRG